jgi:hypothetical protein
MLEKNSDWPFSFENICEKESSNRKIMAGKIAEAATRESHRRKQGIQLKLQNLSGRRKQVFFYRDKGPSLGTSRI